jgi:hypothetical protein
MKTPTHILASLGYFGAVSFLADHSIFNYPLALVVIGGGLIVDVVDHPLYQFGYGRNNQAVREIRDAFKEGGLKNAIRTWNKSENERKFKGLLLHNAASATVISTLAIIASLFIPGRAFYFGALGALLLHVLCDIWGDYQKVGHSNNWFRIVNQADENVKDQKIKRRITKKVIVLLLLLTGFAIVTLRWGWQLYENDSSVTLFGILIKHFNTWLWHVPMVLPAIAFVVLYLSVLLSITRYSFAISKNGSPVRIPFSNGSIKSLSAYLFCKKGLRKETINRILLQIQSDQSTWILICGIIIALLITIFSLVWGYNPVVIFVIPTIISLLLGTYIHTTTGQVGGLVGILLSWAIIIILSKMRILNQWPNEYTLFLGLSTIMTMLMALIGGMFLKGRSRMSLASFAIKFRVNKEDFVSDTDRRKFQELIEDGCLGGYIKAHESIFGNRPKNPILKDEAPPILFLSSIGKANIGNKPHQYEMDDGYYVMSKEMKYSLLSDELQFEVCMPVLPRTRTYNTVGKISEISVKGNKYYWIGNSEKLLTWPYFDAHGSDGFCGSIVQKTWSEFIDNMATQKSTFRTNVFISNEVTDNTIVIIGITRELTSTKEYASLEAETYAGEVMNALINSITSHNFQIIDQQATRIIYPQVSIFDESWIYSNICISSCSSTKPEQKQLQELMEKYLEELPQKNIIPYASANYKRKLFIWLGQAFITILTGNFILIPLVKKIIE